MTFAAGSATAIVNVQTLDDTQDEADETVTLSIGPGSFRTCYVANGQTQATGTILDNDAPFTGTPATITVAATDGSGTEAADGSPDFTSDTFEFLSAAFAGFVPDDIGTDLSNKEGEIRHDMSFEQNVPSIDLDNDAIAYTEVEPINHTGLMSNTDFVLF